MHRSAGAGTEYHSSLNHFQCAVCVCRCGEVACKVGGAKRQGVCGRCGVSLFGMGRVCVCVEGRCVSSAAKNGVLAMFFLSFLFFSMPPPIENTHMEVTAMGNIVIVIRHQQYHACHA